MNERKQDMEWFPALILAAGLFGAALVIGSAITQRKAQAADASAPPRKIDLPPPAEASTPTPTPAHQGRLQASPAASQAVLDTLTRRTVSQLERLMIATRELAAQANLLRVPNDNDSVFNTHVAPVKKMFVLAKEMDDLIAVLQIPTQTIQTTDRMSSVSGKMMQFLTAMETVGKPRDTWALFKLDPYRELLDLRFIDNLLDFASELAAMHGEWTMVNGLRQGLYAAEQHVDAQRWITQSSYKLEEDPDFRDFVSRAASNESAEGDAMLFADRFLARRWMVSSACPPVAAVGIAMLMIREASENLLSAKGAPSMGKFNYWHATAPWAGWDIQIQCDLERNREKPT